MAKFVVPGTLSYPKNIGFHGFAIPEPMIFVNFLWLANLIRPCWLQWKKHGYTMVLLYHHGCRKARNRQQKSKIIPLTKGKIQSIIETTYEKTIPA